MPRGFLVLSLCFCLAQLPATAQEKIDFSKLNPQSKFGEAYKKATGEDGPLAARRPVLSDEQIAQLAEKSTVVINIPVPKSRMVTHATGFLVAKGVLATNHHVIEHGIEEGTAKINYLQPVPMTCFLTRVIADDPEHDVALLEVKARSLSGDLVPLDAPVLPLANSFDTPHKGEKVFLTGNPGGCDLTFSHGEISAFRSWEQIDEFMAKKIGSLDNVANGGVLQYDAPSSCGGSGSAVLNDRGEVLGVNMMVMSGAQNITCASRVQYLRRLMQVAKLL